MIGAVGDDGLEAMLTVSVMGFSGDREARVEAVVDTGFTGHITLRPETAERLALSVAGCTESILADGSIVVEEYCLARVAWHETERPVQALIVDAEPLLGMSLLRGRQTSSRSRTKRRSIRPTTPLNPRRLAAHSDGPEPRSERRDDTLDSPPPAVFSFRQ
ncbi:MAG: aspartyl protease family protein [Actinomycetota bacterium]|nr:aspartyl protease family protein [Actinomycetota bacterium]